MRCRKLLPAALLWLVLATTTTHADPERRARLAGIAGSERLQMFAYGKLLETGAAPRAAVLAMKQSMIAQGFYYEPGQSRVIATEAWVAPILSYDGNINGGVLQDSFVFNGYVFQADPAFRAKSGMVLGASGGTVGRLAWSNGRYVEASLRAQTVWSPDHQITRSNAEIALCSRNHLQGWSFLDLCRTVSGVQRELGESLSQQTALTASQLFQTSAAYHEISAELALAQYDTGDQPMLTLGWNAVWDTAATRLSLTQAEPIAGETALENRITAEVNWLWRGRAVGLGIWHQTAGGGSFLGSPRADATSGINISYQLRPGITAQLGYSLNASSVDFYDYAQTSLDIRLDALRW